VVPSAGVRAVVSGGIATSVAGRVSELAAACRERVNVGATGRRSSVGGTASCQVMNPGPRLSSVVLNPLVEGAPGATNLHGLALVSSSLHFHTPAHYSSGSLTVANSVSFNLIVSRSSC